MIGQTTSGDSPRLFPPTRWSVVLAARKGHSPESAEALETICRAYWPPLYAYVRRTGQSPHDAQDLTQEFFTRLLEKKWLDDADRDRGRLRTFLIVTLKHFMSNEWRKASAKKRGGGCTSVQFDTTIAETVCAPGASPHLPPEQAFDRQWALTLLELTFNRLEQEFSKAGKARDFEILKPCLTAGQNAIDYTSIAQNLSINEGAARVAVHRLRKRFREVYREELSQTLRDGEDVEAELRHLAAALANT